MLLKLQTIALECGLSCSEYWAMSLAEISATLTAKSRAMEREQKFRLQEAAYISYSLAGLIGAAINAPKKFPSSVQRAYPELFNQSSSGIASDWRDVKAYMQGFSTAHNKRWKGGNS